MSEVSYVVHLELSSRAFFLSCSSQAIFSSCSSRGFWCSRAVRLWFISSFIFGLCSLCSLLLLQHRVVEVVGFLSSWSFGIRTWNLLLSTSSLKLKSRSFIILYIHTSCELHFISLAFCDLTVLSFILLDLFDPQPLSCFFERYRLGVSQMGIPSVLRLSQISLVLLNFLGMFDLISSELDISSELLEDVTTSTRVGSHTPSSSSWTHVGSSSPK
jgi:hypothetical protein